MATLTLYQQFVGACVYIQYYIQDVIQHYYVYLILTLPKYLFASPILKITQMPDSCSSDSDDSIEVNDEPHASEYYIYISQLMFILKPDNDIIHHIELHGAQLKPLIDDGGKFFIGHLLRFYPTLDIILLKYIKVEKNNKGGPPIKITRVITVDNRKDIYNNENCSMGVVL